MSAVVDDYGSTGAKLKHPMVPKINKKIIGVPGDNYRRLNF